MSPLRHPALYQINTRVWLTDLSRGLGRPAALDDIPDAELDRVAGMGFDWVWLLTGHPSIFSTAPIFLTDGGTYSTYTSVSPGGAGWDVGWLTPPSSGIYSSEPDKLDASMTSPLQRLLAMNVNGVLELWFALDIRNQKGGGSIYKWGPDHLYYAYAYAVPMATVASDEPWKATTS